MRGTSCPSGRGGEVNVTLGSTIFAVFGHFPILFLSRILPSSELDTMPSFLVGVIAIFLGRLSSFGKNMEQLLFFLGL